LALVVFASTLIFFSSTTVQQRIVGIFTEVKTHRTSPDAQTSAGLRVEFWRQALAIVRTAPIIGHGTGTVRDRYQKAVAAENPSVKATVNAHNQTLMVAIPLGIVGALILSAMWIAHFGMFLRGTGLAAWIGLLVVAQNILGGLFNTHLFDFVQGWLYVFGTGVMGGMMLARANARSPDAGRV
jgi:O-antigen ligase